VRTLNEGVSHQYVKRQNCASTLLPNLRHQKKSS
jgi:hypothetical protein